MKKARCNTCCSPLTAMEDMGSSIYQQMKFLSFQLSAHPVKGIDSISVLVAWAIGHGSASLRALCSVMGLPVVPGSRQGHMHISLSHAHMYEHTHAKVCLEQFSQELGKKQVVA